MSEGDAAWLARVSKEDLFYLAKENEAQMLKYREQLREAEDIISNLERKGVDEERLELAEKVAAGLWESIEAGISKLEQKLGD